MAGKSRQKSAANVAESVTLSLNERILKDCHALYTDSENGEIIVLGAIKRSARPANCAAHTVDT